jgi:CRP/FNR family transcriptional regulator, cyclic AMP receptor protein
MPPTNIARFLSQVPLFQGLSSEDLRVVARIAKVREARKGETIFSKETRGDALFVVMKGLVKIFALSETGKSKTFAYLEPPDFFGEMALLEKGERSAGAVAVAPASLLTIRRQDFQKLLTARPQLAFALLRTLCARLRRADKDIEAMSFNSVLGRVARIVLDLAKRHGKQTPAGLVIRLELSHQELAEMVGTAREMVTRILNRFVRTKCLAMDGKYLVVTDARKLREWIF